MKIGAALLFLVAAALPESVWLGAHLLAHHHDESAESGHELAELATVLVHRHAHEGNVPDHEHVLAPATVYPEASRGFDSVRTAAELLPGTDGAATGEDRIAPGARRPAAGSGPPLLALLCTLRV